MRIIKGEKGSHWLERKQSLQYPMSLNERATVRMANVLTTYGHPGTEKGRSNEVIKLNFSLGRKE